MAALCLPTLEHVPSGGGELHLCGLEEGRPDNLHAGCQQRARSGCPGGSDDWHPRGEQASGGGAGSGVSGPAGSEWGSQVNLGGAKELSKREGAS